MGQSTTYNVGIRWLYQPITSKQYCSTSIVLTNKKPYMLLYQLCINQSQRELTTFNEMLTNKNPDILLKQLCINQSQRELTIFLTSVFNDFLTIS